MADIGRREGVDTPSMADIGHREGNTLSQWLISAIGACWLRMKLGRVDPQLTRDPPGHGAGLRTLQQKKTQVNPTRLDPLHFWVGFGRPFLVLG
ncbi:hypothetical protein PCASD_17255 [Puccinia coronata f. sp. avenae]|uniref:Uncharacterized protein n=1 Tax=Puccinia coronata f. sp. avenae TaxID=200324 RepID=A0A2N5U994_9BASI|nr:hypothetical protein PCASD_17255 [Puccinia coronata f. sp. avenae]